MPRTCAPPSSVPSRLAPYQILCFEVSYPSRHGLERLSLVGGAIRVMKEGKYFRNRTRRCEKAAVFHGTKLPCWHFPDLAMSDLSPEYARKQTSTSVTRLNENPASAAGCARCADGGFS